MRYIATVIAALVLSTACHAEDWGSVKFVTGLGNNSCGKYLAAVHGHPPGGGKALDHPDGRLYDDHFRYMAWLSGFFSATNWLVMDEHNQLRIDNAAVDVWIRKWCEQNPTKALVEAAWAFVWDQRKEYLQAWFAKQETR
jgi:hypothetical protein